MGEDLTCDGEFLGQSKLNFDPADDVQLWTLSESGWVFPLFCTPSICRENKRAYWLVRSALIFSHKGGKKLDGILRVRSVTNAATFYTLRDKDFTSMCKKREGITPQFYLRVPEGEDVVPENFNQGVSTDESAVSVETTKLSEFLSNRLNVVRPGVIRTVLKALGDHAPEWLVESGRPIDLGSFKITALPYRKHWKETLCGFYGLAWMASILKQPKSVALERMASLGVDHDFRSHELIAMHHSAKTVRWTLEVEETKNFTQFADDHEKTLYAKLGQIGYSSNWSKRIVERFEEASAILLAWLEKASDPGCVIHQSPDGSRQILVARLQSQLRLKKLARHDAMARSLALDRLGKAALKAIQIAVEGQDDGLSKMLDLQPHQKDLRDSGSGGYN